MFNQAKGIVVTDSPTADSSSFNEIVLPSMLAIIILSECKRREFSNRSRRSDRVRQSGRRDESFKSSKAFRIDMRIIAAVGMRGRHTCRDRFAIVTRPHARVL